MRLFFSSLANETGEGVVPGALPLSAPVTLNTVLHDVLQKYQKEIKKGGLVVRCESLPVVDGLEDELYRVFENLLSVILDNGTAATKPMLHIHCSELNTDVIDLSLSNGTKTYQIQYISSLSPGDLNIEHQQKIRECVDILERHKGKLTMGIQNTGCMFTLTIPGSTA